MNLFLITEFCKNKEGLRLLVSQAAVFSLPLCLAHPSYILSQTCQPPGLAPGDAPPCLSFP